MNRKAWSRRANAARKVQKASFARIELGRAVVQAYEHGWRLEHPAFGSPKYYGRLSDALLTFVDLESRASATVTVQGLRDSIERAADVVKAAAAGIAQQGRRTPGRAAS